MVWLNKYESDLFYAGTCHIQELVENWFLVPEDFDEKKLCREVYEIVLHLNSPVKDITQYTILTTTDCNARCFYCYEKGRVRYPMTRSVALDTARFIQERCNGKKVHLQWFGGEPLFNKGVISLICSELDKNGVEYESGMITNAYLMDAGTASEAKNKWKLKSVQITLDGTEDTYNKAKAYIHKGTNPYRIVLDNIHSLLKEGIKVKIRLNIELYNADNMTELVDELSREFYGEKGLSVYTHPLYGETIEDSSIINSEKRKLLYQRIRQIDKIIRKHKLNKEPLLDRRFKLSQCMADNDSSITIMPDGHIGKCEHFTDSDFIGHINGGEFDRQMVKSFKELAPEIEACNTCPDYPDCRRLLKCEAVKYCYTELQEELFDKIRRGMLSEYDKYKEAPQCSAPKAD